MKPEAHTSARGGSPYGAVRRGGEEPAHRSFDPVLLDDLRNLETRLRSAEVAILYADKPDSVVRRFVDERRELSALLDRLESARLEVVADRLEFLSGRLRVGIRELQADARRRADAMAVLDRMDQVLGVAARIAALAV